MIDEGHKETDDILEDLEERIKREYRKAAKDTQEKLQAYLEKTEKGRLEQEALLQAGRITQKQYNDWVYRHTMVGKRWAEMQTVLAQDMHEANGVAMGLIKNTMPDVYALNMNYGTYDVEHGGRLDTGFTLYNHDAAAHLLGDERELMPGPSAKKAADIRANKDMQWNRQHIQSAVLQGILQGESPYDVAGRLRNVAQMNATASIRYARTMTTSAQNAGRYDAFRRAKKLGVNLTIEWQATLDNRTRHEHRMLHGQRREVDEPFVVTEANGDTFEILYPAEGGPGAADLPQRLIWNCRCTLLSWVKGFEGDTVTSSPKMGDMSFEEWRQAKAEKLDFHSAVDPGKISTRDLSGRGMSNSLRRSPFVELTEDEINVVKGDAASIQVPLEVLRFNTGDRTGFDERTGFINIRGDVFSDADSTLARDRLSVRAVLAHEYYGHYLTMGTSLPPGDWRDEFRASYRAAIQAPNLSDLDRQTLMRDALDRAAEAGVTITLNGTMRRVLYGFE